MHKSLVPCKAISTQLFASFEDNYFIQDFIVPPIFYKDPCYHTKNSNDENFQGNDILKLLHNPLPCHP
jgi:hypothetical protein